MTISTFWANCIQLTFYSILRLHVMFTLTFRNFVKVVCFTEFKIHYFQTLFLSCLQYRMYLNTVNNC